MQIFHTRVNIDIKTGVILFINSFKIRLSGRNFVCRNAPVGSKKILEKYSAAIQLNLESRHCRNGSEYISDEFKMSSVVDQTSVSESYWVPS